VKKNVHNFRHKFKKISSSVKTCQEKIESRSGESQGKTFSLTITSKIKHAPFGKCYTCFGCEAKKGITYVVFQDKLMFSHII